jgi:hypothetical protein
MKREDHDCEFSGKVDCDICSHCGEHSGFCEHCGESECCGAKSHDVDMAPINTREGY